MMRSKPKLLKKSWRRAIAFYHFNDPHFHDFDAKVKIGDVTSTLTKDGFWSPHCSHSSSAPEKSSILSKKLQLDRLKFKNDQLRYRFDVLFDQAKRTAQDFSDMKAELSQLHRISKKTGIGALGKTQKTKSKSKSK